MKTNAKQRVEDASDQLPVEGRHRAVIAGVRPEIEDGRFPIKRTVGDTVEVEADIFADGHDVLRCVLLYRHETEQEWSETEMKPSVNDLWRGTFPVSEMGFYRYAVRAWVDPFGTWLHDMRKRIDAGVVERVDLLIGAEFIEQAGQHADPQDAEQLRVWANTLHHAQIESACRLVIGEPELERLMRIWGERRFPVLYDKTLRVRVDREKARFSAWYELFVRSTSPDPHGHGTFRDCIALLPDIKAMGFDVLYLPPIHPIGRVNRKGKNNTLKARPDDVGSPWAIGSDEGGHKSVHPQLGTLEDFRALVEAARHEGIEIALDIAYQCAPDHPYVRAHPEWFRGRPDNTIQYAENPPKKYEDIYPFDFETEAWPELWRELRSVILYWIEQGVRIFRIDNPHTKPFPFWEWLIGTVQEHYPETIFLAEAFTRPKIMQRLAKLGFTQSYTYFAWRNTSYELSSYLTELTQGEVGQYMRGNLWPNTPDILTEYLQTGGRAAFAVRLLLAATLGASYGIYGPAFELCEDRPREPFSEEYLDSEKYQIRRWDLKSRRSLRPLITRINRIRHENPALQRDDRLRFHATHHDHVLCYSKATDDNDNIIVTVVNLDPHHAHSAWVHLPLHAFGLPEHEPYQVHDLLSDARYIWHGGRNYVGMDPRAAPGHIFRIRRRLRTERDFEYYL